MSSRVLACAVLALVSLMAGTASAATRYTAWSNVTALSAVDTPALEFANAISKDGLTFYFQRGDATSSDPALREDIWITTRDSEDAPWSAPTKLSNAVNSSANDRAAFVSPDGHWLFFASDRGGTTGFDLYVSWRSRTHDNDGWQAATKIDALSTSGFDSGPTVFEDELTGTLHMYFVSNPSGPQNAAVDIYESVQGANGGWSAPSPVSVLNSSANEGRPYVRHDGLEIFFNSARTGFGPADIWVSTRASITDAWSTPVDVVGISTAANEITPALSWDGQTLYFTSNRSGTNGVIYVATRAKERGAPSSGG